MKRFTWPLKYRYFEGRVMPTVPEIRIDELMTHLHPMQPLDDSYLVQIDKKSPIGKLMVLWEPQLKVDAAPAPRVEVHHGGSMHTEGDRRWFVLPTTASDLLRRSVEIMDERAKEYDSEEQGGERSMAATVAAFNAIIKDSKLSESEGWLFMQCLKLVRDRSTPSGHKDSIEDNVAYAALYGESRLAEGRAAADAKSAERMTALIKANITADTDGAPRAPEQQPQAQAMAQRFAAKVQHHVSIDLDELAEIQRKLAYVYRATFGIERLKGVHRKASDNRTYKLADLKNEEHLPAIRLMVLDLYEKSMETP